MIAVCLFRGDREGFSALQRAENSSTLTNSSATQAACVSVLFSEPKIPQVYRLRSYTTTPRAFQCSSASRKFLNCRVLQRRPAPASFSALQRAENSSIYVDRNALLIRDGFSALQRAENSSIPDRPRTRKNRPNVSVLFSEPKIPQSDPRTCVHPYFRPR